MPLHGRGPQMQLHRPAATDIAVTTRLSSAGTLRPLSKSVNYPATFENLKGTADNLAAISITMGTDGERNPGSSAHGEATSRSGRNQSVAEVLRGDGVYEFFEPLDDLFFVLIPYRDTISSVAGLGDHRLVGVDRRSGANR